MKPSSLAFGVLLASGISSANADIIISTSPGGTGNNVVFSQQAPDQTGTTIFGNLNTGNTLVTFTSQDAITSPSGGQARIAPATGSDLTNLAMTVPGDDFSQLVLNLNAASSGTVTFDAFNQLGTETTFTDPLSANGQNFFTLTAIDGQSLSSVGFTSSTDLTDVSQIRFGSLVAVPGPTLGAGLPGLVLACAGLMALARRRRKLA